MQGFFYTGQGEIVAPVQTFRITKGRRASATRRAACEASCEGSGRDIDESVRQADQETELHGLVELPPPWITPGPQAEQRALQAVLPTLR